MRDCLCDKTFDLPVTPFLTNFHQQKSPSRCRNQLDWLHCFFLTLLKFVEFFIKFCYCILLHGSRSLLMFFLLEPSCCCCWLLSFCFKLLLHLLSFSFLLSLRLVEFSLSLQSFIVSWLCLRDDRRDSFTIINLKYRLEAESTKYELKLFC